MALAWDTANMLFYMHEIEYQNGLNKIAKVGKFDFVSRIPLPQFEWFPRFPCRWTIVPLLAV